MKRLLSIGLAALLLPAFVACRSGRSTPAGIDWQEGERLAVAFLGYYDSFGAFETSPSYAPLTQAFPQIVEAAQARGAGRELYLVVPRSPKATLTVGDPEIYGDDSFREVLCSGEPGKPVLVLCNWYEPDRTVVCADGEDRTVSYMPQVDRRTAALLTPADGSVRDISRPLPRPLEGFTAFNYSDAFPDDDLGISVRLEGGQPVLTCTAAPLERLGFTEDSFAIREGDSYFSGIDGLCQGVFIGTEGQDDNPVVCVVMANGDVKMCSVFNAIRHGGPHLSGALPGFKDVTGFESGGGGQWEDEATGETNYDYRTIYALDVRGGRTEIPYFRDSGTYKASDGEASYEVTLTPDWQFSLTRISRGSGLTQVYNGSFSEAEEQDGAQVFPFRVSLYSRFQGDAAETDESAQTGTFSVRSQGPVYEVTLAGVEIFPDGTAFRAVRGAI